jgi:sortase A
MRLISYVMLIAGFTALGYVAYVMVSARYFQKTEAAKFEKSTNIESVLRPPAVHEAYRTVANGTVIGILEIPSVGVQSVVVQGDSNDILRRAVGHVPGTPMPGEAGNVALAGHRDTIFRPLRNIKIGDIVELRRETGAVRYRVSATDVVPPNDLSVLEAHGYNELTLITCYPFYFVGHAPDRFIVRAEEITPYPQ